MSPPLIPLNPGDRASQTRLSVLDYVGTSLTRRAERLGTEDRHKIELHLDSIRNMERQLSATEVIG